MNGRTIQVTLDAARMLEVLRTYDAAVSAGHPDPIRSAAAVAYGVSADEVTSEQRTRVKNLTFGHRYGMETKDMLRHLREG